MSIVLNFEVIIELIPHFMKKSLIMTVNIPIYGENVTHYTQVSIITKYIIVDTLACKTSKQAA